MKRTKTVFERIAQQNRLLWLFMQHDTTRRNKLRILNVLFPSKTTQVYPEGR